MQQPLFATMLCLKAGSGANISSMQPNYPGAPGQYPMNQLPPQYPTGSGRKRSTGFLVPLIISVLLLIGALGFGLWAFASRQDYKNNTDQKVSAAVEIAKQQKSTEKDKEFTEKEKSPFKTYTGPSNYGSLSITYPKTWSAFMTETSSGGQPVEGYLHPNYVPGLASGTAFALRIQVLSQSYDAVLKGFEGNVKNGKIKASPIKAAKVPTILGTRLDGEINVGQKDSMVIFPLRDKTLKIWTESDTFIGDFNTVILPNLSFVP